MTQMFGVAEVEVCVKARSFIMASGDDLWRVHTALLLFRPRKGRVHSGGPFEVALGVKGSKRATSVPGCCWREGLAAGKDFGNRGG